jgi:thiol-disulfide isomerase/thioredoxin
MIKVAAWAVGLLLAINGMAQQAIPTGYKIDLNIKPYQNQWVYLAYYYGGIKGLADSAYLDANSKGAFMGSARLPQGVYIVASPNKTILWEMLIPEEQLFSVSMDTLSPDGSLKFTGSTENDLFTEYTRFIGPKASAIEVARKQMETTTNEAEKKKWQAEMEKNSGEINKFRLDVISKHPESMLALLFKTMQEVPLPAEHQNPKTRQDSINQYYFSKAHYWDNFDFMDGRLVRTPIFENKLKSYINNWVVPDADSIIYEMNWMMALGRNDPEMSRFLVSYFIDNYMYPKIMGHDKVFLHAFEKYVANDNPTTSWLNEKQRKAITERAYMVMANQLGSPAYDMALVDTAGKVKKLYDLKNQYVVISFWDPHCGKCKEDLPKIDSLYKASWKKNDVQVYAVMVNEEAAKDWTPFIRNTGKGWVHVHQTKEMRAEEEKTQQPNFRQLYDMRSTPTLFLLDKDKRIIAKNLGLEDLDNVLQQKLKQGK